MRSASPLPCSHLFLCLLELGERDQQTLVHVLFTEELHGSLVDGAGAVDVGVLLLEPGVLDPVLHFRVNNHE